MKTGSNKNSRESGLALIILVAIIMLIGLLAYTFLSIVSTHRYGAEDPADSYRKFYIAEGALEIGRKYIADLCCTGGGKPAWAGSTDGYYFLYTDQPLGDGTFDLGINWTTQTKLGTASLLCRGEVSP